MGLGVPDETAEEPRKPKNTRRLQRRTEAKKYKKAGAGLTLDDGEGDEREEVGEDGAYFGDEEYAVTGTGEGGDHESVYEVRYGGEPERARGPLRKQECEAGVSEPARWRTSPRRS